MRLVSIITLFLAPASLLAQRQAVLPQITAPHPYYYREMYLPQVTTGPSAPTWSPDGRALIYSMQGSLWRQSLGSTIAEQLTNGAAYDFEPDWSHDGRFVAFARYDGAAIELALLDLVRDTVMPLTSNRAVNVEPRWSPDDSRLAFVSTGFEGRFHVWTMPVSNGAPGTPQRITDDRDSKLPRYYYSVWDHYLSPTWSPDGKELLVISNRGRVMGTGGFWRMRADASDSMRLIHYEETSWKARPDWSPDGKRIVYSSYAGRQRNALWLMTADGGDPFQLTYGDYDATAPRWSPDGRHVAYISNEDGNTSLWVIDLPGSKRTRVVATTLRWRAPMGTIRVVVSDGARKPLDARVSVTSADGRTWAPRDAMLHADDSFDRSERRFEEGYFHAAGGAQLDVPTGDATVIVTHGLEWARVTRTVHVRAGRVDTVRVALRRLVDLPARGWWSGDLHVHMNYGGAYRMDPARLAFQARAEDLHVVENLIVNKEQRIPDIALFTPRPDPVSTRTTLIMHGQEFHTSWWGHVGLLGLGDHLLLPDYAAYPSTAAASLYPANANVIDLAHAESALGGYVHPFDEMPNPDDTTQAITDELPVDVALGKVDYMEILGFSDHRATAQVWYKLLNCGFALPAGAGTDAMTNFASLRGPVGLNRVFVRAGRRLDHTAFLRALRAGRSFATNGPLLALTVNGHGIGDSLRLPLGAHRLTIKASMWSIAPVEHLELVANGKVIAELPLSADHRSATATTTLTVNSSEWITLRAWSQGATPAILDLYPFATTSPIYVTVGGVPVRSPDDARWFVRWIDRLEHSVRLHQGWNTEEEKASVLELLKGAREEFVRRSYIVAAER